MKKSIKKLELNKRTIANLNDAEMNNHFGGQASFLCSYHCNNGGGKTKKGKNCPGHSA